MLAAVRPAPAVMDATTECLAEFGSVDESLSTGGTLTCTDCDPNCDSDGVTTPNNACTFKLKSCLNQAEGTCTGATFKKIKAKAKCATTALAPTPVGTNPVCGPEANLVVNTKKKGKKAGKCKVKVTVMSTDKPKRVDKDTLELICAPQTAASCPTTSTTSTSTTTTSTTTFPQNVNCEPIVAGQPVPGTYQLLSIAGAKICSTSAAANKFMPCTTDVDCGGTGNSCVPTPLVTADGITLPFPAGINTTFTVAAAAPSPGCNHVACVNCGNPDATCTGIVGGCTGNPGCISDKCCDQPNFTAPSFSIPALGACSRIDQKACGLGEVNTSNPQVGDNEVFKEADTSDPGTDCLYGTGDDPAAKPCNTCAGGPCGMVGEGADTKGKIVRTLGNGAFDASGIQFRFVTPQLSTTWAGDGQGCPSTATYDGGETILSQIILQAEPTTAGARAQYVDMNSDGCSLAGAGFSGPGPIDAGPAASPAPYGGGNSTSVAVGFALSGSFPLFDIGFVAVTPNGPATVVPAQSCGCTPVVGCPE